MKQDILSIKKAKSCKNLDRLMRYNRFNKLDKVADKPGWSNSGKRRSVIRKEDFYEMYKRNNIYQTHREKCITL